MSTKLKNKKKVEKQEIEPKSNNIISYIIIGLLVLIIIVLFLILKSDKEEPEKQELVFQLNGADVTLQFDEEYDEPGFYCYDGTNNYAQVVEVSNNIVYKTPGEYTVTYKYQDKILTRKVTILEPDSYELVITYTVDKTDITNEDVTVSYNITGITFQEVLLPDGNKSTELEGNFVISTNGDYEIKAYNVRNEEFTKTISVNNIDKELPTGTCDALAKNKSTEIKVTATDNNKIAKYEYYDNTTLLNSSEVANYTSTAATSVDITVKVYDVANNVAEIKCNVTEKRFYDPIKPNSSENIVYQSDNETLKAYITKGKSYYLTRIWALDPYTQFRKAPSPEYGKKLYYPVELLKRAMNDNNLQNKEIIGFNASGFYLSGVYDASSVRAYPAYDKTAVGTIVINNGVVVRNAYDKAVKQWYLVGINKDNQMVIFEDNVATTAEEINNKKAWSQTVLNSGIRNTFSFAGPVIQNGQKLTKYSDSMPDPESVNPKKLQLMCQINDNNFVLFTSANENRKVAIDLFVSLGCKTGFNFDGGGSIALIYKPKGSDKFTTVVGGLRELPEAGYFTE